MAGLRSINQDDLRTHNLSVVLSTMLRSTVPLSRADLAKETRLTKATMSLLVSMLLDNGIVYEGAPVVQSVYGRPSTPLIIRGGSVCGIGVQINTDGYGYLILDLDGSIIAERWIDADMDHPNPDDIFGDLNTMLIEQERLLRARGYHIAGTGLALPGLVGDHRELLVARNLGWERLDLNNFALVERLNASAGNEADMAAIAQLPGYSSQRHGESPVDPSGSFLYISTDIGIGGAFVRDGHLIAGDHGFAGEIGHLSVQMDGPLCRCGRHGCLEVYAGRRSMVEAAGIATGHEAASSHAIDELLERWQHGDPDVSKIVTRALHAMASAIISTINFADTSTVIIGGLWSRMNDAYLAQLEQEVQSLILGHDVMSVRILRAPGASRPSLLGAAEVGLRQFIDNPLAFMRR